MKKSLLRISGIILIGIAVLLVMRFSTPEDTWTCQSGQRITHGKPSAAMPTELCAGASTGGTIDLTNCISYFDGCNTCMIQSGQIAACTKMFCETPSEPKCLEYARTGSESTGLTDSTTNDVVSMPTETPAGWKTYQNEKFQFTFSYPSDWTLAQNVSTEPYYLLTIALGKTPQIYGDYTAWVNVVDESEISKAITTYIKNFVKGTTITKEQKIVIDDIEGKLIYVNVGGDNDSLHRLIFISHNSKTYIIGISFDIAPFDKQFDQIVSTFKFTK